MSRRDKYAAHFGRRYWLLRRLKASAKRLIDAFAELTRVTRSTRRQIQYALEPAVTPKQTEDGPETCGNTAEQDET